MRIAVLATALSSAVVGLALADPAAAAIKTPTNIAPQELSSALRVLAADRHLQILYTTATVANRHTSGAVGEFTVDEALTRLLGGTGLAFQYIDENTITIMSRNDGASTSRSPTGRGTEGEGSAFASEPSRSFWSRLRLAQIDTASPSQVDTKNAFPSKGEGQGEDEKAAQSQKRVELEEIVITGTHIRGLDNLTAPLIVMDREFIDSTGFTTPIQLIESLPQNFALVNQSVTGGGLSGNSYSVAQGSTISLRGVGEGTTLTLINGRRVPLGYDGSAVNIAALPLSAIERVEVLTDGASALYGSDAVGGVVNFILRREFDGAETRLRGGAADDVDELRLSQTFGHSWSSGNVAVAGEYYTRDMLLGTDRDLGIGPNTTIGSLLPEEKNFGVTLFGRQDLTDNLELFVDVLYTDRDSENRASHATPTSNRTTFVDNTQLSATAGLALDFAAGWRAEISGGYGEDDAKVDIIDPPSPTTTSASVPVLFELRGAELKADGPLFDLPGGTVRLAVGAQWREESQLSRNIFRNAAGVTTTNVRFERDREVDSLYTEVSVPLVGEGNARLGLQRLDLSLAARYDDYSDFGSSTDPRVGLAWKPTQSLVVRGSWGTSYLAPKMREFDVAFNSALAVDNFASANGLHILQVNGNAPEGLGPQESENFTIGLDWAPLFLPGARFAVNYYDIEYENRVDTIGGVSFFTINSDPSAYETVVIFDPTDAQVLEYIAYGTAGGRPFLALNPNFTPNPNFQPGDVDLIIDARRQNIGVVKTTGFDVSASYDFGAFGGRMRLALDGSWMDELTKQITSSSTPLELLDTFANPTRRRLRGQVGFRKGGWTSNAFVHYRDAYTDNRFPPFVEVDSHTSVDANVGYSFGDSAGLLSNATIALNAINVLDEDPPPTRVRATTGVFDLGFDPANASPLGRLLTVDLTKRW